MTYICKADLIADSDRTDYITQPINISKQKEARSPFKINMFNFDVPIYLSQTTQCLCRIQYYLICHIHMAVICTNGWIGCKVYVSDSSLDTDVRGWFSKNPSISIHCLLDNHTTVPVPLAWFLRFIQYVSLNFDIDDIDRKMNVITVIVFT